MMTTENTSSTERQRRYLRRSMMLLPLLLALPGIGQAVTLPGHASIGRPNIFDRIADDVARAKEVLVQTDHDDSSSGQNVFVQSGFLVDGGSSQTHASPQTRKHSGGRPSSKKSRVGKRTWGKGVQHEPTYSPAPPDDSSTHPPAYEPSYGGGYPTAGEQPSFYGKGKGYTKGSKSSKSGKGKGGSKGSDKKKHSASKKNRPKITHYPATPSPSFGGVFPPSHMTPSPTIKPEPTL